MYILITGANGFLGGKTTRRIIEDTDFDVIAVASTEEKVRAMCEREGVDRARAPQGFGVIRAQHALRHAGIVLPPQQR